MASELARKWADSIIVNEPSADNRHNVILNVGDESIIISTHIYRHNVKDNQERWRAQFANMFDILIAEAVHKSGKEVERLTNQLKQLHEDISLEGYSIDIHGRLRDCP